MRLLLDGQKLELVHRFGQAGVAEVNTRAIRLSASDGSTDGFVGVVEDVTERRRSERRQAAVHAVARITAGAETLAEAGPCVLEAVCDGLLDLMPQLLVEQRALPRSRSAVAGKPLGQRFAR